MNPELFARVKKVYESRDRQSLTPEQSTLLEDTWKSFIKGGANLESAAQKRFQEIAMELPWPKPTDSPSTLPTKKIWQVFLKERSKWLR